MIDEYYQTRKDDEHRVMLKCTSKLRNLMGTLIATKSNIAWYRFDAEKPQVSFPYSEIQQYFVNKGTVKEVLLKIILKGYKGSYVFEFPPPHSDVKERDELKELIAEKLDSTPFTPRHPKRDRESVINEPFQPTEEPGQGFGNPELIRLAKYRATLLSNDANLKTLHQELVVNNRALSEDNFWAWRETRSKSSSEQIAGISNSMLTDVRPTTDRKHNTIHYKLTPSIIHQIFLEYPVVHKAYSNLVPIKLSEKEFWVKYFQSQVFQQKSFDPNLSNLTIDGIFAKYIYEEKKEPEFVGKKAKFAPDTTLESADEIFEPENRSLDDLDSANNDNGNLCNIIRRIHRHDALILNEKVDRIMRKPSTNEPYVVQEGKAEFILTGTDTLSSDQSQKKEIPELTNKHTLNDIPLSFTNPTFYFRQQHHKEKQQHHHRPISPEKKQEYQVSFQKYLTLGNNIENELALEQYFDTVAQVDSLIKKSQSKQKADELNLPVNFRSQLFTVFVSSNELLRHFWGCYPVTSKEKANKLVLISQAIETTLVKYKEIKAKYSSETWGAMLNPILESFQKALAKYKVKTNI